LNCEAGISLPSRGGAGAEGDCAAPDSSARLSRRIRGCAVAFGSRSAPAWKKYMSRKEALGWSYVKQRRHFRVEHGSMQFPIPTFKPRCIRRFGDKFETTTLNSPDRCDVPLVDVHDELGPLFLSQLM